MTDLHTGADIAGLAAFILAAVLAAIGAVRWLLFWLGRPRLRIAAFDKAHDLANWQITDLAGQPQQRVLTAEITNDGKRLASRCIAIARVLEHPPGIVFRDREVPLHWAGTPWGGVDTGAQPVDIGRERRRLDIVFSRQGYGHGAWLATPAALGSGGMPQVRLPPGDYVIEIELTCDGGDGARVKYHVTIKEEWDELDARPL